MLESHRNFIIWLLVSLLVGAALGAYLTAAWKEREIEKRVAAAVQVEKDRSAPLREEVDALRLALDKERLLVEVAAVAGEVEASNYGLARERLVKLAEELRGLADRTPAASAEAMQTILARQEEITADLEALDPKAAEKLRRLFGDLREALGQE